MNNFIHCFHSFLHPEEKNKYHPAKHISISFVVSYYSYLYLCVTGFEGIVPAVITADEIILVHN